RPVEVEGARYENFPAYISPSPYGAHSWHSMSYNPQTGLAYFPAIHYATTFSDEGLDLETFQLKPFDGGLGVTPLPADPPRDHPASLIAWDPVRQEAAWQIPQATGPNGGTLTTAGNLVFQGRADGHFTAYDAATGEQLWDHDLGLGIPAAPITYELDGRQYVSILVGWGGGVAGLGALFSHEQYSPSTLGWEYGKHMRRLVTFSLDGNADMPPLPPPYFPQPLEAAEFELDDELAEQGAQAFGDCLACHGADAIASGMAPDLRASPVVLDTNAFKAVVRDGAWVSRGMPAHPQLSDADLVALQHYIRQRARESL
ncbi:MAG: c-type cytochrome, partial [Xanthomonadales bacterium]|nr:c-type cytochrome [Xanthomonadales bacterium]